VKQSQNFSALCFAETSQFDCINRMFSCSSHHSGEQAVARSAVKTFAPNKKMRNAEKVVRSLDRLRI
jgi:hypothetical protein